MNYKKIYEKLMSKAKKELRNKNEEVYYELHHIVPRSFGGSDDPENLVLLTAKEHWIAHLLLTKFSYGQNRYKANHALINMGRVISKDKRKNSKLYENARKQISSYVSKKHKGTLVVKDKETNIRIGRVSKNHPKVISGEWVFFHKGEKRSEEKNKAHSKAMTGIKNPKYSGITDEEILEKAFLFYKENKCLPIRKWQTYSGKEYGFPMSYSNFRFKEWGGGTKGFKNAMKEKYKLTDESFKYIMTEKHRQNIKGKKDGN